jgi:hypothetical protein
VLTLTTGSSLGAITNRGDIIHYVYTDSNHTDPLHRITPAKLISTEKYEREKYLEMLLDSAEAVLAVFGFSLSSFGFDKHIIGGMRYISNVSVILNQRKQSYEMGVYQ